MLFDDRPENCSGMILSWPSEVRGSLRRRRATDNVAASETATGSEKRHRLVADARSALNKGDHQKAQHLAIRAQQHDAHFGLLEDRPETVLEEAPADGSEQRSKERSECNCPGNL